MQFSFETEGGNFSKAGTASSEIKKILNQLNVDYRIIKRVIVALYEAEVNIVAHAHHGWILVDIDTERIRIILDDEGPGIPDIEKAMEAGYSTASAKVREMGFGAGMGLPNIRKNADEFRIESEINKGTKLEITVYFK
ncbi:MAG: anti-sigma regulatory factor [Sphingobacteriia bacterium]|nr:anti-sigma regulatory factor [Sphingobacteriia bacterium]